MKKGLFIYVVMFLVALVTFSCKPTDDQVKKQVNTVLEGAFPNTKIEVAVKDGVATLSGEVGTEAEKMRIEGTVTSLQTIDTVVNNITVKPQSEESPDNIMEKELAKAFWDKGFVKAHVSVKNGEVTLTGVASKNDIKTILDIVDKAKPTKVVNQLKLK